jgi:hypothetical protein
MDDSNLSPPTTDSSTAVVVYGATVSKKVLVNAILEWIGRKVRFSKRRCYRAMAEAFPGLKRGCQFGPALNKARDELRKVGVEFAPLKGNDERHKQMLVLADDERTAERLIEFLRGANRKHRRAAAIGACVKRPEKISPVLRCAYEGAMTRSAILAAASRLRKKLPGI